MKLAPVARSSDRSAALVDLRVFIERRTGVAISDERLYFFEGRLSGLLDRLGLPDVVALNEALAARRPGVETAVIEAAMVHETLFFRDRVAFEGLERVILPDLLAAARGQPLSIWSAACATGQEPYSLAMMLREALAPLGREPAILATDLSESALLRAREGVYTQFEVQRGLAVRRLLAWFDQEGTQWRIRPALRELVRFEQHNLMLPPPPGRFDLILCRNVMIYFGLATRAALLRRLASALKPGGYLLLGSAESFYGLGDALVPHRELHNVGVLAGHPAARTSSTVRAASLSF